jgi:type II secretory pathway component PulC
LRQFKKIKKNSETLEKLAATQVIKSHGTTNQKNPTKATNQTNQQKQNAINRHSIFANFDHEPLHATFDDPRPSATRNGISGSSNQTRGVFAR